MYADRVESATRKRSINERINNNPYDNSRNRTQISGKRHREEDDKWVRDLYEPHELQGSNQRVGSMDLRLKLQRRKSIQQATQIIKDALSGGTRDLQKKLSATVYSQTVKTDAHRKKLKTILEAPRKKLKTIPEVSQPDKRSIIAEAPASETKQVSSKVSKKKSQQKVESVDSFLQALGLEKYTITFQAEEVDMAALVHMTDEDLKAMGMPMGPRKKILSALESKV
ncbi:ankyrin repeat and SAM domain-containing protein 6 [Capsicum galapagoense]